MLFADVYDKLVIMRSEGRRKYRYKGDKDMEISGYELIWLFAVYSFLGWVLETAECAIRHKKLVSRGVLSGPFCTVYGTAAVIMTVGLKDLEENWLFLFIGCAVYATVTEWITGKLLEKAGSGKWWDYSGIFGNLDGYICLPYSILWGILGVLGLKFFNPLVLAFYRILPGWLAVGVIWSFCILMLLDTIGFLAAVRRWKYPMRRVHRFNTGVAGYTHKLAEWIAFHAERRLNRAYPGAVDQKEGQCAKQKEQTVFAAGCGFYKLVILFFVGAFLGDLVETVFCRITAGYWMSRSSVVWGPFSIVWGLAIAAATGLLHRYKDRSDHFLFLIGTVIGGAYEYLCSVFTELFFGTVFWDYSDIPFNLGGRINLLYCFFWGIAAVIWLKGLYPVISDMIEKIPVKIGKIVTWILIVFMTADMAVSAAALYRYEKRAEGIPAQYAVEEYLDSRFDDERMQKIYPKAVMVDVEDAGEK